MNSMTCLFLTAASLIGSAAETEVKASSCALETSCRSLLSAPFDKTALTEFATYSISTNGWPALKSKAMAIYALSALAAQDTNTFLRVKNRHASDFPDDRFAIQFDVNDCYESCDACMGSGLVETDLKCIDCGGTGRCYSETCKDGKRLVIVTNTDGKRRISASQQNCETCLGAGICRQCKGKKTRLTTCTSCGGQRVVFAVPAALRRNQETLLRQLLSGLNVESGFAVALERTQAETNLETRVSFCADMLASFPSHPQIGNVRKLMTDAQSALGQAAEEMHKRANKLSSDMAVLRNQMSSRPKAAKDTITEYQNTNAALLASDIGASYALELEAMRRQCIEEIELSKERLRLLYLFGGALIILLGLSCVSVNVYRYYQIPQSRPQGTPSAASNAGATAAPGKKTTGNKTSRADP